MNNSFFALTRFLRDRGVDAHLLRTVTELEQFHPALDTYDDEYTLYTTNLSWGGVKTWFTTSKKQILRDLASFDGVIGCGFSPAYATKAGRNLDVFNPYGSDLYYLPFDLYSHRRVAVFPGRIVARAQRDGIRDCKDVFLKVDYYRPYRDALDRLGVPNRTVAHIPIYYPEYDRLAAGDIRPTLRYRDQFERIRDRSGALVISQARHSWQPPPGPGFKGNDLLIRGFARYVEESGRSDASLILFDYGRDVQASRQLCEELRIAEYVHWMPLMPRKELMYGVLLSDVGADQFPAEEDGSVYGGTALEMMVVGKPVLGRVFDTPESFLANYGFSMPPLVSVHSPTDVSSALDRLLGDRAEAAEVGRRSREWVFAEYGGAIDEYLAAIAGSRK